MVFDSESMPRHEHQSEPTLGLDGSGNCRVYSAGDPYDSRLRGGVSSFRIALVKQDCYQDLWIGDSLDSMAELLLSTQMRTGPLGMLSGLGADFYIVQLEDDPSVQLFRSQGFMEESMIDEIRVSRQSSKVTQAEMDAPFSRLSLRKHSEYSQPASNIDWGLYRIVISINSAVSWKLRKQFPGTVWITIPSEGLITYECLRWDYYISHNCPTGPSINGKRIDIPYTFIRPTELHDVIQELGLGSLEKSTIYLEINSCPFTIRPPTFEDSCYAQELQASSGLPVRIHPDTMFGHLQELANAKYFIKTGGRRIRGNSILEAISAGVVVLLKAGDCYGNVNLPMESYFKDLDDLLERLRQLEAEPEFYGDLLSRQSEFASRTYFYALCQLSEAYNSHIHANHASRLRQWVLGILQVFKCSFLHYLKVTYNKLRSFF